MPGISPFYDDGLDLESEQYNIQLDELNEDGYGTRGLPEVSKHSSIE